LPERLIVQRQRLGNLGRQCIVPTLRLVPAALSLHFLFDYYMVRLTKSLDHNIEDAIGDLLDHNRKVQR